MEREVSIATGALRLSSSGFDSMAHIMHTVIDTSVWRVLTCSCRRACMRSTH